ncbi:hypothetical protein [Methylobacterium sp. BTF04]|nr:hypothetical protein [Methylobacterium sp. BTF04]
MMTPRGIWWTRRIFGLKYYILFVLVFGLLIVGFRWRGFAI